MKFVIAALVVTAVAVFLLLNMNHQAELWLFTEFQISTLALFGIGFFAGAALVFLAGLWRHWRKDTRRTASRSTRNSVFDEDL